MVLPTQTLKVQNDSRASEAKFLVYLSKTTCSINSGMKEKEAAAERQGCVALLPVEAAGVILLSDP